MTDNFSILISEIQKDALKKSEEYDLMINVQNSEIISIYQAAEKKFSQLPPSIKADFSRRRVMPANLTKIERIISDVKYFWNPEKYEVSNFNPRVFNFYPVFYSQAKNAFEQCRPIIEKMKSNVLLDFGEKTTLDQYLATAVECTNTLTGE